MSIAENDIKYPVISVEDEMSRSYLDYAMSVIVSRALPDVRDGMKPVHRRIAYAMEEGGYHYSKPYKKSARIVGDVMGKYHPHGDSAIYDAMVRMAQPWSVRHPLVDGQGNFGSMDNDPPAAMRYTEARMSRLAHEMVVDIDKDTVDWRNTYDESNREPVVLPSRFPNILVNGGQGIAVGMATNIPTHNLGESIDAVIYMMENPEASVDDLMQVMPGPDFPTRGVIMGRSGIRSAYLTGRGSIKVSGVAEIETLKGGRSRIVVSELPYLVNKARFQESLVQLVNDKEIEGISEIRDESDKDVPVRVVIDIKKDFDASVILNQIKRKTQFISNFGYNATCLNSRGRPEVMGLVQILREFVDFRRLTVRRRTIHELDKARDSLHKQIGLYAAISLVDEVVRIIRNSRDADDARVRLMAMSFPVDAQFAELILEADPDSEVGESFQLSEVQVRAILDLNLRSLTGLERDKIVERAKGLSSQIKYLINILNDASVLDDIVKQEMIEIRTKYATDRMTEIEEGEYDEFTDEDLIENKDIVITLTHQGYVKRTDTDIFREQNRGGKGRSGMDTKDSDFVSTNLVCQTKTPLIFFTSRGIAHSLKAYRLPEAAPNARGRPIVNFLNLQQGESITAVLPMPEDQEDIDNQYLLFVTDFGTIRRNKVSDFIKINKAGKIAMKLEDEFGNPEGRLVSVLLVDDQQDVLITTDEGNCIRFPVDSLRVSVGRSGKGVRAVNLGKRAKVIGASSLQHGDFTPQERDAYLAGGKTTWKDADGEVQSLELDEARMQEMKVNEEFLLTVSENGYGKRSSSYAYRVTSRGGKGFAAATVNRATGPLVCCRPVLDDDGLILVTDGGQVIRTRVSETRVLGRTTRGVRLFNLPESQKIVSAAIVPAEEVEEETE